MTTQRQIEAAAKAIWCAGRTDKLLDSDWKYLCTAEPEMLRHYCSVARAALEAAEAVEGVDEDDSDEP